MKKINNKTETVQDYYDEPGRIVTTDCLYCLKEFSFNTNEIDEMGWISCSECDGKHETKGFIEI